MNYINLIENAEKRLQEAVDNLTPEDRDIYEKIREAAIIEQSD